MGLLAAVTAGIASVSASGVITLYPATITGTLDLCADTSVTCKTSVTGIDVYAYPAAGGQAIYKYVATTPPGPYLFDLTVDGGDPSDPADAGLSYRPEVRARLAHSATASSYLDISRSTSILVDNTPENPSATVPVAFSYPTTHQANGTITVTGGTISSYYLAASFYDSTAKESVYAQTSGSGGSQSSITDWISMLPRANVTVYGSVYVVDSNGNASSRSLGSKTVDLSGGDADVSWDIDLTSKGTLDGNILLGAASSSTATLQGYSIVYSGASTSTSGIYGSLYLNSSETQYSIDLTPGDYNVYLNINFTHPSQYATTTRTRVTIAAGASTSKDFKDDLGVAQLGLDVQGFYASSLKSAASYLVGNNYATNSYNYEPSGTGFEHTLPIGSWRPYYTYLYIQDTSNPSLPNSNTIYRYHSPNDVGFPLVDVTALGAAALGTESFNLVKADVYLDVAEAVGQPSVQISGPQIHAYKNNYNPDLSVSGSTEVYSYGSSTPSDLAGLTMVAEPGVYSLDARAYVNGTLTRFNGSKITFGEPTNTPPGSPVTTVLTPAGNTALQVTLTFDQVNYPGGISTLVETPLGPAPPEGFSTVCTTNSDGTQACDPVYYDISTTASWTGQTEVCIRRQFAGVDATAVSSLHLLHYDQVLASWEDLPAPPDGVPAFDCSTDPSVCGCVDAASCGIDKSANPVLNVFLVCGMTDSFSPFAIFKKDAPPPPPPPPPSTKDVFTNTVGGVEYTGPIGPPSLQQWTAPSNGMYRITAIGARGASGTSSPAIQGGCGAEVTGDFALQAGDTVQILVGQQGTATATSGGGGGGSFVVKNGAPLVIGGGGGGVRAGALVNGRAGSLGTSGVAGSTSDSYTGGFAKGGKDGEGGWRYLGTGSGGGGWSGDGASDGRNGEGGLAFLGPSQAKGGRGKSCGAPAHGGYGGGGAGNGCNGGGGGGGYSGGGGGAVGGGGGSLNAGANPAGHEGTCTASGHGRVEIERVGP